MVGHSIRELMPSDTPEIMFPAWIGFVSFALQSPEIQAHYYAETGKRLSLPKNAIEEAVDTATDHNPAWTYLKEFVPWANDRYWGNITSEESE